MLEHGGRLRAAAQRYEIPLRDWLDLSTGINPDAYPVPALGDACWQRLPEDDDGLEAAAAAYYGNARLLPLPGSQAAIQALPRLFAPATIASVAPLYEEHPYAWQRAGHVLRRLPTLADALDSGCAGIVLCNPNNPTAGVVERADVLAAAAELDRRGGTLIVDEAFADAEQGASVTAFAGCAAPNLIVLRSLGKFFGLAGARVGFVFAANATLHGLRELIGPWALAGPAREVARAALADSGWQEDARRRLATSSQRLAELVAPLGATERTALFCTVATAKAETLAEHFARRAILTRCFPEHGLLRFGLPADERGWGRLAAAIAAISDRGRRCA